MSRPTPYEIAQLGATMYAAVRSAGETTDAEKIVADALDLYAEAAKQIEERYPAVPCDHEWTGMADREHSTLRCLKCGETDQ